MTSYLTEEILATVGQKTEERTGLVTAYAIAKFCAAIDEKDPIHLDQASARSAGYADVISPPLFNASVLRPVPHRDGLLNDGQYANLAPSGLGHLQTMLAGHNWESLRPAVAGEHIRQVTTIKSITEREGKTGPILFTERESTIETLDGELLERYTNILLLRAPPPPLPAFEGSVGGTAAPASVAATTWQDGRLIKRPDMIQLFMFAATIWAVHRIHWDVPYAQSEGLKLPVLPGWMLSCYLTQIARAKAPAGQRIKSLEHRYRASAFPGDIVQCVARENAEPGGIDVVAENQEGVALVTGTTRFTDR